VDSVPSGYPGSMLGEPPVRAVSDGTAGIGWITPDPTPYAADPDAGRAHKQSSGGQYSPLWRQLLSPAMGASLSHAKDSDQRSL